jgi:hypothetical protein
MRTYKFFLELTPPYISTVSSPQDGGVSSILIYVYYTPNKSLTYTYISTPTLVTGDDALEMMGGVSPFI